MRPFRVLPYSPLHPLTLRKLCLLGFPFCKATKASAFLHCNALMHVKAHYSRRYKQVSSERVPTRTVQRRPGLVYAHFAWVQSRQSPFCNPFPPPPLLLYLFKTHTKDSSRRNPHVDKLCLSLNRKRTTQPRIQYLHVGNSISRLVLNDFKCFHICIRFR